MNIEQIAIAAYQAYGETTNFKNYQGLPMPNWESLTSAIQKAWIAAVTAVLDIQTAYVLA